MRQFFTKLRKQYDEPVEVREDRRRFDIVDEDSTAQWSGRARPSFARGRERQESETQAAGRV